jgi:hypothetical protein
MSAFMSWIRKVDKFWARKIVIDEYEAGFEAGKMEAYKVVNKTDNRFYLVRDTDAAKTMAIKVAEAKPYQVVFMTVDEFVEAKRMVVVKN